MLEKFAFTLRSEILTSLKPIPEVEFKQDYKSFPIQGTNYGLELLAVQ